jgi:hypothetical protein
VSVEELEAKLEELTRERDAANAKHETLSALVEGYRRERDNLRAEITKAQRSFDDDGPSGWMPGETAIDALIRTRNEAQSAWQSEHCLRLSAESALAAAKLHAEGLRAALTVVEDMRDEARAAMGELTLALAKEGRL